MKLKAMLSQPMAGKSPEEIEATRDKAIKALTEKGYEIVNTLFTDSWYNADEMHERGVVQIPLCFLAKSLENMSKCHAAYFCKGWEKARGCRIEHEAAVAYGLTIIYEEEPAMDNEKFIDLAKDAVKTAFCEKTGRLITKQDVFVVWYCKTLQNHKAILSVTGPEHLEFEVTYNGDKKEMYLDGYEKFRNRCINLE